MPRARTTPTRISSDIAAAATAVARSEERSPTQQLNRWARIGMQYERAATTESRRVLDVVRGDAQFAELSDDERAIAHALVDASIAERGADSSFGAELRAAGWHTVSLDDDGSIIRISPDGEQQRV